MDSVVKDMIDNGLTLLDVSLKYDISVLKIRRYIASLKNSIIKEEKDLYELYLNSRSIDKRKILEDIVLNDLTLVEASIKHSCSVSTIKKYISSIKDSKDNSLKKLYDKYKDLSKKHSKIGAIKGGQTGIRKSNYSSEQINYLYRLIVEDDYTLRELESKTGIKKSTIYDLLMKNLDLDEIKVLENAFRKHKENTLNDYDNDVENSFHFHRVGSELSRRR